MSHHSRPSAALRDALARLRAAVLDLTTAGCHAEAAELAAWVERSELPAQVAVTEPTRSEPPMPDRRYERVTEHLVDELEKNKPSLSPDAYPVLDPYLYGFERGLERAQHVVTVEMARAFVVAQRDSEPERP